jgi:hypothetical protein
VTVATKEPKAQRASLRSWHSEPVAEAAAGGRPRGKKRKGKEESQTIEAKLFQQIKQLHMKLEWLKKSLSD